MRTQPIWTVMVLKRCAAAKSGFLSIFAHVSASSRSIPDSMPFFEYRSASYNIVCRTSPLAQASPATYLILKEKGNIHLISTLIPLTGPRICILHGELMEDP